MPYQLSLTSGVSGTRPREVFRPTSPLQAESTRIEPPPSEACAAGTTPAATSAAAPPEEPPVVWLVFQGLRVMPKQADSVISLSPCSGEVLVTIGISPAAAPSTIHFCSAAGPLWVIAIGK